MGSEIEKVSLSSLISIQASQQLLFPWKLLIPDYGWKITSSVLAGPTGRTKNPCVIFKPNRITLLP